MTTDREKRLRELEARRRVQQPSRVSNTSAHIKLRLLISSDEEIIRRIGEGRGTPDDFARLDALPAELLAEIGMNAADYVESLYGSGGSRWELMQRI